MKRLIPFTTAVASLLVLSSCGSSPCGQQAVAAAPLLGTAAGAVIGHQSRYGVEGAFLGGFAGSLVRDTFRPRRFYDEGHHEAAYRDVPDDPYLFDWRP